MWNTDLLLIFTFVLLALVILVGGFVIRPFLKRLGDAMDRYLSQKSRDEQEARQLEAVHDQLESLDQRMALMEERLDFTESLVTEEREKRSLDARSGGPRLEEESGDRSLAQESSGRAGSGGG